MSATAKKSKIAAKSDKKTATKAATKSRAMTKSHARAIVKAVPSRAKRLMRSNPLRVLLGAAAAALVAVKLKQRFA
jgi:hypothetical protein